MGSAHRRKIILRFLLSEILKGTKTMNSKPILAIAMVCLGVMIFTAPRSYALKICWGNDPNDTYEVNGQMDREPGVDDVGDEDPAKVVWREMQRSTVSVLQGHAVGQL